MSLGWETDDSGFVKDALREWNFRNGAWSVKKFGELPAQDQSWVLMRASELKAATKC